MSATNRGAIRPIHDFYETPAWCVDALFEAEPLCGPYYDPACGTGAILRILAERDQALGLDIHPPSVEACIAEELAAQVADYLSSDLRWRAPGDAWSGTTIVMNPPYKLAAEFVRAALEDVQPGRKVAALLRLNFLGSSRKRLDLVGPDSHLRAVHVLSRRPSFTGDGRTDACEYAWFVWESGYEGSALISVVSP
jgi:SAM-dependent methyltransferase